MLKSEITRRVSQSLVSVGQSWLTLRYNLQLVSLVLDLLGLGCTLEVHLGLVMSNISFLEWKCNREKLLTSMRILRYNFTLCALIYFLVRNHGKFGTVRTAVGRTGITGAFIHGSLERIAFPSKYIVCMLTKASASRSFSGQNEKLLAACLRISLAIHKWLAAVGWPHVGEDAGVPNSLHE